MKIHYLIALLIGGFLQLQAQTSPQFGKASVYDNSFDGQITASGVPYNKNDYTAAHKSLPFGSVVRVENLDNSLKVNVTINDRGSFVAGHIVDLSEKAATVVGLKPGENANVKLTVLKRGEGAVAKVDKPVTKPKEKETSSSSDDKKSNSSTSTAKTTPTTKPKPKVEKPTPKPAEKTVAVKEKTNSSYSTPTPSIHPDAVREYSITGKKPAQPKTVQSNPKTVAKAKPATTTPKGEIQTDNFPLLKSKDYTDYGLYKFRVSKPKNEGFGVQVAYLTDYTNVLKKVAQLQDNWFENILVSVEKRDADTPGYKIILGPFPTKDMANAYEKSLKMKHSINGFVIDLASITY